MGNRCGCGCGCGRGVFVMWCSLVFRDGRGCRIQLNPRTWPSKISGREQSKFIYRGRVVEATYGEGVKKQKKKKGGEERKK